ncbi:MAG: NUDIX hydrolase [Patescibacteria group bacterium]
MKKISARGIVIKDNAVLLMYREKKGAKYYSIPGGKVEPNETLENTVIRELLEETCIKVKPLKLLGTFTHTSGKEQNLFLCEYISGEVTLGNSVEMKKMANNPSNIYKPQWVSLDLVENLVIRPIPVAKFFKNFIKSFKQ